MERVWKFIHSAAVIMGVIQNDEMQPIHNLMTRYADRPMDFADATLVHLADRENALRVFTVDQADFATYRTERNRRFQIFPANRN